MLRDVPRVADVRAGDLDGDGDLDLSVALFGYDQGETRWLRNPGGWRFESQTLQELSGPINAEIADVDGDRDLDIVTLVSQQWEEIYVHVNDGRGGFTARRIFGASNEDFGSSWISLADLDADGDPDVVYSNGDAFDYATAAGRSWNGVQWLENTGGASFTYHRIADIPGASSPQAADLDGDGDLDIAVVSAYNNWANPAAQSLVWLENDGRATFTLHDVASAPTHLVTLAIGDLTGDGRPDLVTGGMHMSWPYNRLSRLTLWTNQWGAATGLRPAAWGLAVVAAAAAVAWLGAAALIAGAPAWRSVAGAAASEGGGGGSPRGRSSPPTRRRAPAPSAAIRRGAGIGLSRSQRPAEALAAYAVAAASGSSATGGGRICAALLLEERGDATAPSPPSSRWSQAEPAARPGLVPARRAGVQARPARGGASGVRAGPGRRGRAARSCRRGSHRARRCRSPPTPGSGWRASRSSAASREAAARELRGDPRGLSGIQPGTALLRELDRGRGVDAGGRRDAPSRRPTCRRPIRELDAVVAASVDADLLLKHAGLATRAGDAPWREFLLRRALAANPRISTC